MEIFNHNIKFNNWGEIFFGLKLHIISVKDVVGFCDSEKIIPCNEDRMIKLCIDDNEPSNIIYNIILNFIKEDGDPIIEIREDELPYIDNFPPSYYQVWILEMLLRIDKLNISVNKKLEKVYYEVYYQFGDPEDMLPFMIWRPNHIYPYLGDEEDYKKMKEYIALKIEYMLKLNEERLAL